MKLAAKVTGFLIFIALFLIVSAWMVREWILENISLPVTEEMMNLALKWYDYQNQEEVNDALAWLGFAVVIPMNALVCLCVALLWNRWRERRPL
jgi:hypothetical protein